MEVVEAEEVVKRYGATAALAGVTTSIGRGVTGLLGANGAGKTTLLGLLLGLDRPDAGSLRVLGLDPASAGPEVRALVGYSPEHRAVPPDMAAYDLVAHLAAVHGLPARAAATRASDALWHVGLGEERFRQIGTMSTGQVQRVKIAAALAHDPKLLLLDEPTDGLDPTQRDEVLALIRRIGADYGIDVVLSSHLLDEVERVCDSVVILGEGRVLAAGPLEQLRARVGGWVLEVDDGTDRLAAALVAEGLTVTADAARLLVEGTDDPHVLRDAVAGLGLGLVRLQRRRLRLEDVMLSEGLYDRAGSA
jgi:ABC-2 type transport system ATP-binding protein